MTVKLRFIFALFCMGASSTLAKASFMNLEKWVGSSDVVAVVEVTSSKSLGPLGSEDLPKKGHWSYSQENTFRFTEMIHTSDWINFDPQQEQMLWAEKSFLCARASYAPGRYVVFLESTGTNEWITVNHHLGGLRIDAAGNIPAVNWYLDSADKEKTLGLNEVKRSIQEAAASLLPPILACEQAQHRIVLLNANKEWNSESAVLWQWSASTDDRIADEHKAWFSHPSDAKCIATNQQALTVASGGGMALVDVKTKQVVGYGNAGSNPHSATLLPDGRIVTASSTGDLVQLFERQPDKQPMFQVIQKLNLTDAHGVVWDAKRGCVWAMGGKQLKRFDYDQQMHLLTLVKTLDLPETKHPRFGGHDLVLQEADDKLWLSDMEHLWSFDPETHSFTPLPTHRLEHVKSISRLSEPELTIVMQATTNWWSDTVRSLDSTWKRTLPGARFYKARWWHGGNAEPKCVLAHYMPWYSSESVSGEWGWHWTMNHFNPDLASTNGQQEIASHYHPLIGPYDSNDPHAVECHVLLMKFAGIDGVIVDWYGTEDFRGYSAIHRSTQHLFKTIKKAGLKFSICYEDRTIKAMVDGGKLKPQEAVAHATKVMNWMEQNWFQDEAYVTLNGRPVLLVFGPTYFDRPQQWKHIFSDLSVQPVFFALPHLSKRTGADGAFGWPPVHGGKEISVSEWKRYLADLYAREASGESIIAPVFPGFHDIYGTSLGSIADRNGVTFDETLELAMKSKAPIIQLVTWNDYGEGTIIEPTAESGYRYLETLQKNQAKQSGRPSDYAPEDLRLPVMLYKLRKQCAGDSSSMDELDKVSKLLFTSRCSEARSWLTAQASTKNRPPLD